jgi:hypothetical protein
MAHPSDRGDPINQGAGRDPDPPPRRGGYSLISSQLHDAAQDLGELTDLLTADLAAGRDSDAPGPHPDPDAGQSGKER